MLNEPDAESCAVTLVDLDVPLDAVTPDPAPAGRRYNRLRALVRVHGDMLATVEMPLPNGALGAADLLEPIWQAARGPLEEHLRLNGCMPDATITRETLLGGLACSGCGAPAHGSEAPRVSVVMCTVGSSEHLGRCLASIVGLNYPNFELVVVDNLPDRSGVRQLVDQYSGSAVPVRYVPEPVPGLSRARNRGIADASGVIVAFTDDDVEVDREWLSWIVAQFVADQEVGVVTGLVVAARLDTMAERGFEDFTSSGRGLEIRVFDMDANAPPDSMLFPFWGATFGSGNNMAFRKSALDAIQGFDEALGMGTPARTGEDIDAFTRALLNRRRLVYEPRALCWHFHRQTGPALHRQMFSYGSGAAAVLTKWSLREPQLILRVLRAAGRAFLPPSLKAEHVPRESSRFRMLLRMNREQGALHLQLTGFALGPVLYAHSVYRARRARAAKSYDTTHR